MRTRHILLTSAASVSLYLTAAHLPDAHAQKGTFLSPTSQWAVTKIAGNASAGQAGYCAVAKRYGGEAIMTIARNQSTETSFALDLQKPVFNASQALSVTLDPGAGEQRDYSVTPASAQAFVVRLGRDDAFFNAVDRTGLLRVEVAERSYVFNISDIELGQNKLNTCLASKAAPTGGANGALPDQEVAGKSDKAFIAKLNQRIALLESQNVELEQRIASVDTKEIAKLPVASGEAGSRADVLRAQNLRLKAALQTELVEQHNEKLKALEADNKRLSAKLSGQADVTAELSRLQNRVDVLLDENARLEQASLNTPSVDVASLEGDIARLQNENQSLQNALTEQAENDVSAQLKLKIQRIEAENNALKNAGAVSSDAEVSAMRLKHQQEISTLQNKIQDLMNAQKQVSENDDEINALQGELSSLRRDNVLLQQELSEKEQAVKLSALGDTDIDALVQENEILKVQADKAVNARSLQDRAIAALADENVALKTQLAQAPSGIDNVHDKLAVLQSKLLDAQQDQAEQQGKFAALLDENIDLKSKLSESMEETLSLANVQSDVSRLKREIASKDAELAQFDGVPERLSELLASYQAVKAEKVALEGQEFVREDLEAQLAAAQAQNDVFEEKLAGLQKSVIAMASLNAEVKTLHGVLAEKEKEVAVLDGLRGQLDDVLALNANLKQEKLALASAFEDAQQKSQMEIAALQDQFNVVVAANDGAASDRETATKKLADENVKLRETLSSALDKIVAYGQDLKDKDSAIEEVLAQNDALLKDNAARNKALEEQSKLAASVVEKAPAVPKKAAAQLNDQMTAGMILASAGAVSRAPVKKAVQVSAPEKVAKIAPPRPLVKPDVKTESRVKEVRSVAEELAQIMPAAGDEELDIVVAQADEVVEAPEIVEDAQDFMERDLNQAQIYEEQLKRGLNNQQVIEASREEPIEVETLEDGLLEDDSIDAVIEKVAADSDVEIVQESVEEELAPLEVIEEKIAEEVVSEPVEVRMSQDPFEGIAQEVEGEAQAAAEDVSAPVVDAVTQTADINDAPLPVQVKQPESTPVEMPIAEVDMADESAASNAKAVPQGMSSIERVLQIANVVDGGGVKPVSGVDNAYQWRANGLYGSGEQKMIVNAAQFDAMVKNYLSRTEERCTGDFAIVPDRSQEVGLMRVDSYEIACVGDGVSSSASLVFYNEGDTFTALAHETEADKMDQAMAARDKVFNVLTDGRDS